MRVLFTSFPAVGHFHPMAPVAVAVREAGHDVRIASGSDLAAWATACGFDAHAVGPSLSELIALATDRHGVDRSEQLFTDLWVRAALPGLLTLTRSWIPGLIVHEEEDYAGPLLAAMADIAVVTHSWHSPARAASERHEAGRLLAGVWDQYRTGMQPRMLGDRYLDACPPPLQNDQIASIDHVLPVRPVSFDGPSGPLPDWTNTLARPAAYLTLGTVPVFSTPQRLRHLIDAVAPVVASLVVTTGPNSVGSLGALPANVRAIAYLPQTVILDRVDVVISQGGAGGTLGAIEHALPHLMLPFDSQSQRAAATAIDRLGAGRHLEPAERTEPSIQSAIGELLDDPTYRSSAAAIRRQISQLPSPADVVGTVLATPAHRTPGTIPPQQRD